MPSDIAPVPTRPRIGYVVKAYPRFSETFVVTEILAREAAGDDITVFALRPTSDARFHPELSRVRALVHHLVKPTKLTDSWEVLAAAQAALPHFATRFADLMPFLARVEATDVFQGLQLALAVQRQGITHLHVHFASLQARVARIAAALAGISYSVTTHAKDLFHESVDPWILGETLGHADHVIAISAFNHRFLTAAHPHLADRIHLVRNGIDLERFRFRAPVAHDGPLRVAGVGRLVEKKGFDLLVEATRRARLTGTGVEVRIAGDGERFDLLARQIADAGPVASVTLLGPQSQQEVRDLLDWADVLVAPCVVGADGNADGLPSVLLEAMAMGVPCISTDVTGIPEAVHPAGVDGPATGVLLPSGDPGTLTDLLVGALRAAATPAFPRHEIAVAARRLVEEQFDTRRQSRLLGDLQQPLMTGLEAVR